VCSQTLAQTSLIAAQPLNKTCGLWINKYVGQNAQVADLEALYRARYQHFLRVAILITSDQGNAHDAVQEAFAATIRSLPSYRSEGPLEAWVWRAVVNAAKKQQRHSSAPALEDDEPASAQNGYEAGARVVRTWVASLPERQRLTVYLRYYADLDYREIATVLDVAVGTVSATLSAAHRSLRKTIEEVPQ
jgi:RNA polymerase sigma factor (sigma-70 family)